MPEAKRDEVPLPEPVDELCGDDGFNVIGVQPVYTADQLREYGRQCVQAAVPVMPQGVREAINPFLVGRWPHGAASRIGTLIAWLRSQSLIKE